MSASTKIPLSTFTSWLACGERGLSSEAIVSHLTGSQVGRYYRRPDYPRDPADFRRCQLLLNAVPLARLMFPSMCTASPEWARLVDSWDEIHETIEREVPDYLEGRSYGSAPLGYRLMQRVIAGGTKCETCDGTGNAEPCPKCKGTGRRSGGRCRASGCYRGHNLCGTCRGAGYTGGTR